jgi:hypothetical protein
MSLSISQILSASYPAVVAEKRRPANQWSESALLSALEKMGAIKRVDLGGTIEAPLDYRRNAGAQVLATDLQSTPLTKTEVMTAASYSIASISVPIVWSKEDEAKTPTRNSKVDFVDGLINNALDSHDDLIEQTLFVGSNGLLGFDTLITEAGTGSPGGIDASLETWWKNKFAEYTDDTNIEAVMTSVWNACTKGTGSGLTPKLLVSDAATQALFESTQQAQQRFMDTQDLKAGFKTLAFKTANYVFSQYGTDSIYFTNPKSYQVQASRQYFRQKGKERELENAEGFKTSVYSALQVVTNNRSRLGVAFT